MPELSLFESDAVTRLAMYDQIESLTINRKLRQPNTFRLEVSTQTPQYEMLTRGRYVGVSDLATQTIIRLMRIDQLERSTESDSVIITGKDYAGWFDHRLCIPPTGSAYHSFTGVKAETVLKTLVSTNAGPLAATARQLPNLVIETDQARGQTMTMQARYQSLTDMLEEVCNFDGGGYQVVYVPGFTNMHRFEYISPTDRSATVFLDLEFESALTQQWIESDVDMKDTLYVAGQGEGVNRTIINRYLGGVARSGLSRREALVDARDIADPAALTARGDSILAEMAVDNRHAATLFERGSFRYGTHFFLGDIVTVQNSKWNLHTQARVIAATLTWTDTEQPSISVEIARPWPTIKERISQEAYGMSTVQPKGAVDYHSENHSARHTTGGADPVTPSQIGAAPTLSPTFTGIIVQQMGSAAGLTNVDLLITDPISPQKPVRLRFHHVGSHWGLIEELNNEFSFKDGGASSLIPINASAGRFSSLAVGGVAPSMPGHQHGTVDLLANAVAIYQGIAVGPTAQTIFNTTGVTLNIPQVVLTINATAGSVFLINMSTDATHSVAQGAWYFSLSLNNVKWVDKVCMTFSPGALFESRELIMLGVNSFGAVAVTFQASVQLVSAGNLTIPATLTTMQVLELKR